jgi:hypothetical protein
MTRTRKRECKNTVFFITLEMDLFTQRVAGYSVIKHPMALYAQPFSSKKDLYKPKFKILTNCTSSFLLFFKTI